MLVRDYIYIDSISGETNYEQLLIEHFKINTKQLPEKVHEDLLEVLKIVPIEGIKKSIYVNKKKFMIENDFLECTYEQFTRLDNILSENNNIQNIHKLLAIYCRPFTIRRWGIEKFNIHTQDDIAERLLSLDMNIAQGVLLFFYQNAAKSLLNMNISYLNQKKMMNIQDLTKNKSQN